MKIAFAPCGSCGPATGAVARRVETEATTVSPEGEVVDRSHSEAFEDLECASCAEVLRDAADLTEEEVGLLFPAEEPEGESPRRSYRGQTSAATEYAFTGVFAPVGAGTHPHGDRAGARCAPVGYDLDLERDVPLTIKVRFEDGFEVHVFPEEIDDYYDRLREREAGARRGRSRKGSRGR